MKFALALLALCLLCGTAVGNSLIVCPADACARAECAAAPVCTGPYEELGPGGFCGCCLQCVHILQESDVCLEIMGVSPPATKCARGLKCINEQCQKDETE